MRGYSRGNAEGDAPWTLSRRKSCPLPEHVAALERLGDEIAELSAHLDAATARLLDLIREFDARAGWSHGFRSCADWLSWRVGLDKGAARERVRVARALGTLPRLARAFAGGEISYSKVRALTRVATPATEDQLLAVARAGTAVHVERIVRGWRYMDRKAEVEASARHHTSRALHVSYDDDGTVVIRGRLAPEAGALFLRALEAARETLYQRRRAETCATDPAHDVPTMEQQRADALALLAETALHQGIDPGAPGERYQVVVHVDAAVLADAEQPGHSVLEDGVTRSRGNVAAPGVRREPRRHAARRGRARGRGRRPHADDPAGVAARAAASGPRLPLPRAAECGSARAITSVTGRPAARRCSPISRCSAGGITAACTKTAIRSSDSPTARSNSGVRTGACCPMSRLRRRCPDDPLEALCAANVDARTPHRRAHGAGGVARRALGRRLGDRCPASSGQPLRHTASSSRPFR